MNLAPLIDLKSDEWVIKSRDDLYDYNFSFNFLPNDWFKQIVKKITFESISIGKLSEGTLHRYNYSLEMFFKFVEETNLILNTFSDITPLMVEQYVYYLLFKVDSPSTRNVKMAALKHHIRHGQILDWDGFPLIDVFDGTEYRTLQSEDTLKSKVIDDRIMKQIDIALNRMEKEIESIDDACTWGIISLVRHTGIRIHEALKVEEKHLSKDFTGKYLLEVLSDKNKTERYIPVSNEVSKVIKRVSELTKQARSEIGTEKIFVKVNNRNKKIGHLKQYASRYQLRNFIKENNITDSNGVSVKLTYHQFRHTIGTDLLNNGMSMSEVMEYLGHDSSHSTRLYAKVRNDRLTQEYQKLGFIGVIEEKIENIKDEHGDVIGKEKRLMAQLPDGVCARPIKEKVINCKKPNACLFCPKFITTPEFINFHKNHLERIKADKYRYLEENLIGSDYLLFETEKALEEIISRLEEIITKKGV